MQILPLVSPTRRLHPTADGSTRRPARHGLRRATLGVTDALRQVADSALSGGAAALLTRGDLVLMVRGYGHDSSDTPVTGLRPRSPTHLPHRPSQPDHTKPQRPVAAQPDKENQP